VEGHMEIAGAQQGEALHMATTGARKNLNTRGMKIDTECVVCNRVHEDVGHCWQLK
jgi:hypothetical protein